MSEREKTIANSISLAATPDKQIEDRDERPEARRAAEAEEKRSPSTARGDLPEMVAARYRAKQESKIMGGTGLYREDGDKPTIIDKGNKLTALSTDKTTVRDLIETAEHRGWERIQLSGSKEFKREAWLAATEKGIETKGYKPTELDVAELDRRRRNGIEQMPAGERRKETASEKEAAPDLDKGIRGTLVERGISPYKDDPKNKAQPHAVLDLGNGKTEKIWGARLSEALDKAGAKEGDKINVQRLGTERVTIRDASNQPKDVDRNVFKVTADEFLKKSPTERAADPRFKEAQGTLKVVEALSANLQPKDRAKAIQTAEKDIASRLSRGETFKAPKVQQDRTKAEVREHMKDQNSRSSGLRPSTPTRSRAR